MKSASPEGAPLLERAEHILAELGFRAARVEAIDPERATAVVTAEAAERDLLFGPAGAHLSRRLKEAGFRYVALDLDPGA